MTPLDHAGYGGNVVPAEPAELVRLLLDTVPGGVLHAAADGAIVLANAEAVRTLELRFDAATDRWLSHPGTAIVHEDGSPCVGAALPITRTLATGMAQGPITLGKIGPDARPVWAVYRTTPTRDAAGRLTGVIVTFLDITERKHTEDELRRSEAKWRSLAENVPDFIVLLDRERRILSANHISPELRLEDLVGHKNDRHIHENHLAEWNRQFETVLATRKKTRFETRGVDTDGSGGPWYETILVPVEADGADESVPIERVLIVARDITARRAMLKTVAEKERLASVGMLSASVVHEIMNPLTYVMANLDFALSDRCQPGARMTKALLDAREGAARMQQIARDLRSLGRHGAEELFYVDVRSIVETALRLAGPEIARSVRMDFDDLPQIPGVLASESRLCQVFINLFVNASQAMIERPVAERSIVVATRIDEAADLLAIDVSDTGAGIDPLNLGRIFDPFFTTKRTGTGLGLSITKESLEQMGGRIEVTSEPGRGTTFTVWLSTRRQMPRRVARESSSA